MQPTSTNGIPTSARDALESLRLVIEKLEADLATQHRENAELRAQRDEYRKLIMEQVKKQFSDPNEWDDFDERDFTLTIDDLLTTLR